MTTLVSALYAEGRTDERFLPTVLQRTIVDILAQRARQVVDVWEPIALEPDQQASRDESILAVARKVAGYHLLFVHADADGRTRDRAFSERIQPGLSLIRAVQTTGEAVCRDLVPVIPVQKVEAWLLADSEALRATIGITESSGQLHIPQRPAEIEGAAHPKELLGEIIRQVHAQRPRRRRQFDIGELYRPLADRISLEMLRRLPAYRQLVEDLTTALISTGFIDVPSTQS